MTKIALITGASRGLGRAGALALAGKGVDVIGTYHSNAKEADATAAAIAKLGRKAVMLQLDAGDTLLLFTDGITEAFDVEQRLFGAARLHAALSAVPAGAGAEAYIEGVVGTVRQFAEGAQQSDDITCLALQYRGRHG